LSRAVPAVGKLNYQNFKFDYEPYPLGVAQEFIEPEFYRRLVENFPPIELFDTFFDAGSNKKALAELYRPDIYHRFIRETPVYLEFYKYIKSSEFIHDVLNCFERNFIRLNLFDSKITSSTLPLAGSMFHKIETAIRRRRKKRGLRARFEFSALPSDGGNIRPHTDAPVKIITLVISILKPGDWNRAWKGGTEVLRPKDIRQNYNFYNTYFDFDECETLRTVEYLPNQGILFLKTFNSLHCVAPIQNKGGDAYRKTLTINIDSA
jgi:hypothetical protein